MATVATDNQASQRVLTKAGMQFVEIRKYSDGAVSQVYAWSVEAEEGAIE